MLGIAIGGFGVLVALGVLIGHALDRQAREDAWRRIATARRLNAELRRRLDDYRAELEDADDAIIARSHRLSRDRPPPDVTSGSVA